MTPLSVTKTLCRGVSRTSKALPAPVRRLPLMATVMALEGVNALFSRYEQQRAQEIAGTLFAPGVRTTSLVDSAEPPSFPRHVTTPGALPLDHYDQLSINALRPKLCSLSPDQLQLLVNHECAHANRPAVLALLSTRTGIPVMPAQPLTKLASATVPTKGHAHMMMEV